nr:hypothetical protein [uncultured Flavobacterium sp.]
MKYLLILFFCFQLNAQENIYILIAGNNEFVKIENNTEQLIFNIVKEGFETEQKVKEEFEKYKKNFLQNTDNFDKYITFTCYEKPIVINSLTVFTPDDIVCVNEFRKSNYQTTKKGKVNYYIIDKKFDKEYYKYKVYLRYSE